MSRRPPPSSSWPQNSTLQPQGTTATSQSTGASASGLHMCCSLSYKTLSQPLAWPIPQLSCQGGFLTLLLQFISSSLVPFPVTEAASKSVPVKLFVVRSLVRLSRLLSKVETITCVVQVMRRRLREVQYGTYGLPTAIQEVSGYGQCQSSAFTAPAPGQR